MRAPRRVHRRDRALRLGAKAMHANLAVGDERTRSDQRSELAGRPPPRQIHLKETILCVQKACRARDILARGASHGWNAERVARDDDRRRQAIQSQVPAERRQTASQLRTHPHAGRRCAQDQQDRDASPTFHSRRRIVVIM